MLEQINKIITAVQGAVWGLPLILLILFTGFLLTVRLGLLQVRHLGAFTGKASRQSIQIHG